MAYDVYKLVGEGNGGSDWKCTCRGSFKLLILFVVNSVAALVHVAAIIVLLLYIAVVIDLGLAALLLLFVLLSSQCVASHSCETTRPATQHK